MTRTITINGQPFTLQHDLQNVLLRRSVLFDAYASELEYIARSLTNQESYIQVQAKQDISRLHGEEIHNMAQHCKTAVHNLATLLSSIASTRSHLGFARREVIKLVNDGTVPSDESENIFALVKALSEALEALSERQDQITRELAPLLTRVEEAEEHSKHQQITVTVGLEEYTLWPETHDLLSRQEWDFLHSNSMQLIETQHQLELAEKLSRSIFDARDSQAARDEIAMLSELREVLSESGKRYDVTVQRLRIQATRIVTRSTKGILSFTATTDESEFDRLRDQLLKEQRIIGGLLIRTHTMITWLKGIT